MATSSAQFGIDVFSSTSRVIRYGLSRDATNAIGVFVTAPFNTVTREFEAGQPVFNVTISTALVASTFYNLEARMNYSTKTFDLYNNNNLFEQGIPFIDPNATDLADADLYVASAAGATDTGFFDNYRVNTIAATVPESNTLALLAFGAVPVAGAVIARRRRK